MTREQLPILFRKSEGEITAVFPTEPGTYDPSTMTCYAHLGQHGACSEEWFRTTKPARPAEYAALLAELRAIYETGDDAVTLVIRARISKKMRAKRRASLNREG